jgi:anhydro-N-acetylmuramic acid kinase
MSGTSLDGLDIAYCEFVYDLNSKAPLFSIPYAETVSYPYSLKNQLKNAQNLSAYEFLLLDR